MPTLPAQHFIHRPFCGDQDFWQVRDLLIHTVPITPVGFNWDVRRWEGQRFYHPSGTWKPGWVERVQLWETYDGQLIGVVNPEGTGDAHFQVHPDYRHIEEAMLAWAEEHIAAPMAGGTRRRLETYALEYDALRQRLLAEHGYEKTAEHGAVRHMRLGQQPLPEPQVAAGYILRATRPDDIHDCERIAALLNAAFHRDFHNAQEYQVFTRLAPCFRAQLDLVAEAPNGTFAAYVGVPYDLVNRRGIFEPVCTHPAHQRKGLARALMLEALHRLVVLGASDVTVDTGDRIPANRLYDSMGFTEVYTGYVWQKAF